MKNKFLHIALVGLLSIGAFAQEGKVKQADKNFEKYAYIDAIKTYERIAEKGYKTPEMLQKLADSHYFNSNYEQAARWYGELESLNADMPAEYHYRYAQSLKAIGEDAKADATMQSFAAKNSSDLRSKLVQKTADYRAQIEKNSGRYTIEDAGVNSPASDYGSAVYGNKMIFTTARDTGNFAKRIHTWDGNYLTNFYEAEMNPDGSLNTPTRLKGHVKSRLHEGTAAFAPDGKTMFFTRNNFQGSRGRSSKNKTFLKIYKAEMRDSSWINVTELPFNSDEFNTAHPAVSPDGKTLYFASDRPGGQGASDLYKVNINADGSFGEPENLGPEINTPGRESFPFVSGGNELYFSSDAHLGLGGFDIFVAKMREDNTFEGVSNIGAPANSPMDDFGFMIDFETKRGFLSSNREGGQGSDDIYRITETKELKSFLEQQIVGTVMDLNEDTPVANATVTLSDENFNVIRSVNANPDGSFDLGVVDNNKKYYVKAEAPDFNTIETPVMVTGEKEKTTVPVLMERTVKAVKVGDNLAEVFNIRIIYFDFDKSDIRPDAAVDLAKFVDVLEKYPTMQIDIQSHTDSRGTARYNKNLSERRAQSTMQWMLGKNVAKNRMKAKGFGETQLVNKCNDNTECSEEEHQLNRRSLFIITAL